MNNKYFNKSQLSKQFGRNIKTIASILENIPSDGLSSNGSPGWAVDRFQAAMDTHASKLDYAKRRQFYSKSNLSSIDDKPLIQPNYELGCDILTKRQHQFIQAIQSLASSPEQLDKIMLPIFYPNGIDEDTQSELDSGIGYLWTIRE